MKFKVILQERSGTLYSVVLDVRQSDVMDFQRTAEEQGVTLHKMQKTDNHVAPIYRRKAISGKKAISIIMEMISMGIVITNETIDFVERRFQNESDSCKSDNTRIQDRIDRKYACIAGE